jgi:hypothetical protein
MIIRSRVSPELRALYDQERVIPPLSAARRASAIARARAALAAPAVMVAGSSAGAPRRRWAAAAAAGLVISAALGAAAYEIRIRFAPAMAIRPKPLVAALAVVERAHASGGPGVAEPDSAAPAAPSSPAAAAGRAELHLLGQARAAVARGDFASSLSAIAEHARRFPNGALVEEREALRVKALAGLGRASEARRAAASFRARFPRSVLLPTVSQMPVSRP